jgi:hypothetical protein
MIFASAHFVLSQLPNFHSISGVSLAAAVMSLWYGFHFMSSLIFLSY